MNLTVGCHLEVLLAEMDFKGTGVVTNIEDCPPIAEGRGEVVTGRFVTRGANNLVEVSLSDGTSITGTTTHPIWIPSEKAWVALGHLEPGMYLDSHSHDVFVVSLTYKTEPTGRDPRGQERSKGSDPVYCFQKVRCMLDSWNH